MAHLPNFGLQYDHSSRVNPQGESETAFRKDKKKNNITILKNKPVKDLACQKVLDFIHYQEWQIDQPVLSFGLHFSTVAVMMIKIQMGKVEDKLTNLSSGGEGIEWIKYESGRKR